MIIGTILFFIIYNKEYFGKIDPTFLTLISGSVGFIISKIIEDLKESK